MSLAHQIENIPSCEVEKRYENNEGLIQLANDLRNSLHSAPSQSHFRVAAIFTITHLVEGHETYSFICGANIEPGNIGGSICAERAAMCRLRFFNQPTILKVAVVTDSEHNIAPGGLCREFLMSVGKADTIVVMGNYNGSEMFACTVQDLFPHPYKYRFFDRSIISTSINDYLDICHSCTSPIQTSTIANEQVGTLKHAALSVNQHDNEDALHPVRLSAAILFDDSSTYSTWQMKGLEYGCTADPVIALVHHLENNRLLAIEKKKNPIAIGMIDQYGIFHAPFAAARSQLCERGYNKLKVLVHEEDGSIIDVDAQTLFPTPGNAAFLTHDDFI